MAYKQGITYEEGTWTPAITGSSSNPTITYTTQSGIYTKIGNMIFVKALITINTYSGGSGQARISLPVASASDSINTCGELSQSGAAFPTGFGYMNVNIDSGNSYLTLRAIKDNTSQTASQCSDLAAGDVIYFTISYWF